MGCVSIVFNDDDNDGFYEWVSRELVVINYFWIVNSFYCFCLYCCYCIYLCGSFIRVLKVKVLYVDLLVVCGGDLVILEE